MTFASAKQWFLTHEPQIRTFTVWLLVVTVGLELWFAAAHFTWPALFGHTSEAAFDFWSFQHYMDGVLYAGAYAYLRRGQSPSRAEYLWFLLFCSTIWEFTEVFTDVGAFGVGVSSWMDGLEHWSNRLITDPLLVFAGGLSYLAFPRLLIPMAIGTVAWLTANMLAPDSMHLQELFVAWVTNS